MYRQSSTRNSATIKAGALRGRQHSNMLAPLALLLCALACTSAESSHNDNANFLTWLTANGATFPPISVKDFDDYGKGLLAVQSIKHGDMIMDIPAKVILSRETIASSSEQHMPYITRELLSKLQN